MNKGLEVNVEIGLCTKDMAKENPIKDFEILIEEYKDKWSTQMYEYFKECLNEIKKELKEKQKFDKLLKRYNLNSIEELDDFFNQYLNREIERCSKCKELKDYQEIKEIAKRYNWDDITSEIFNVKTDKKYRDLFNSAIVNIQEDYRKARALEIIKNHLSEQVANIELGNPQRCLLMLIMENDENYNLLKEVLL